MLMLTSQTQRRLMFLTSRAMAGWSAEDAITFWDRRGMDTVMHYPISRQCHNQLDEKRELHEDTYEINHQTTRSCWAHMTSPMPWQSPSSIWTKRAICHSGVYTKAGRTVLNARNGNSKTPASP